MIKTLNNIKYNNQTLGLFIAAETFMSSLAEMAKNGNNDNANSLNISNIFLQVTDISNDHAGITYATGVNLITGENTKVRLSNIDESANDLVAMKKENNPVNAKHTITRLYTGQKPREELIAKRDKRRANYLFLIAALLWVIKMAMRLIEAIGRTPFHNNQRLKRSLAM